MDKTTKPETLSDMLPPQDELEADLVRLAELNDLRTENAALRESNAELNDLYTTYRGVFHDGVQVADVIAAVRKQLAEARAENEEFNSRIITLEWQLSEATKAATDARAENERLRDERAGLRLNLLSAREAAAQAQRRMEQFEVENERLRAALQKIASSGNVHSSWLVGDAREALGLPRNTW